MSANIEELKHTLATGDLSVVDDIVSACAEEADLESVLEEIGHQIVKSIEPGKWREIPGELALFILAAIRYKSVVQILGPVFARRELGDFAGEVIDTVIANFTINPEYLVDVLLFITSRVAQYNPERYGFVVRSLWSNFVARTEEFDISTMAPYFLKIIDFEPEVTETALSDSMKDSFLHLARLIRDENKELMESLQFVRTLKFWSFIVNRDAAWSEAFLQVCLHALNADRSLRVNPFRLKIIDSMITAGHYLQCVAPLAKILEKSLQEKGDSGQEFDWDTLLVANKEIARNKQYQTQLFETTFDMLVHCLTELANDIIFPEIAVPVMRVLSTIAEESLFQDYAGQIRSVITKLKKNMDWITAKRRAMASVDGFDITDPKNRTIQGKAPML